MAMNKNPLRSKPEKKQANHPLQMQIARKKRRQGRREPQPQKNCVQPPFGAVAQNQSSTCQLLPGSDDRVGIP